MLVSLFRLLAISTTLVQAYAGSTQPTIVLPNGATITGIVQTNVAGKQVHAFKGIPFAEPPVGDKRWRQAKLKPLNDNLNATDYGSICYGVPRLDPVSGQFSPSEDCLYLNVFTPADFTRNANLPVMIWVHGGGFIAGAANPYDGANLIGASGQEIVYVSLNYRLGAFGFLSNEEILTEGDGANFGLRDQEVAFAWVKQYVREFGGNPDDITVFGESAGGMSIGHHMISRDGEQQWFKRAILSSGVYTTMHDTLSPVGQANITAALAAAVGCDASQGGVMSCLRKADASTLFAAGSNLKFMPTVDKVFLLEPAIQRVLAGKVSSVPTLIGTNTDEGWLFTFGAAEASQFDSYIRLTFPLITESETTRLVDLYPASSFATAHHRVAEIFADAVFVCPSELLSNKLEAIGASLRTASGLTRPRRHSGRRWLSTPPTMTTCSTALRTCQKTTMA